MLRAVTCEQSLLCLLVDQEGVPELGQGFEVAEGQTSGLANLVFLSSNWFSECEHPFIDNRTDLQLLTEPTLPSTRP